MIEAVVVLGLLGLFFVVMVPLLVAGAILALILKLVVAIILLPIKAIGWGLSGLFDGFLFLLKAAGVLLFGGLLLVLGLVFLAVPAISLMPLLLIGGLIWIACRMARPSHSPVPAKEVVSRS